MKAFVLGLLIASSARAATCSKTPLQVIYVNGQFERPRDTVSVRYEIEKVLNESHLIDEKSIERVIYNFQPFYNDVVTPIGFVRKALKGIFGSEILASQAAIKFFAGSAAFIEIYGAETFQQAEKAYSDFLKELGFHHYQEAINQVFPLMESSSRAGQKLLVISMGSGTIVADGALQRLARLPGAKRNALHFMFSPLRKAMPSSRDFPTKYWSSSDDLFQSAQSLIPGLGAYPPLHRTIGTRIDYFTLTGSYLSQDILTGAIPSGSVMLNRKRSLDLLADAADSLPNNDPDCCNQRPGKLWRVKTGCAAGVEECLGGFVEKGITVLDPERLTVAQNSYVCLTDLARPVLKGNITVKGKLGLGKATRIEGPTYGAKKVDIDAGNESIHVVSSTVTQEGQSDLRLRDSLMISAATLKGSGTIEGERIVTPTANEFRSSISEASITGNLIDVAGFYYLAESMENPDIAGDFAAASEYSRWNYMHVAKGAVVKASPLRGVGRIEGHVELSHINGYKVGSTTSGVHVAAGSSVTSNSEVHGAVALHASSLANSIVKGQHMIFLPGFDVGMNVFSSNLTASTFEGGGVITTVNMTNSWINGCVSYVGFTLINTTVHGPTLPHTQGTYSDQVFGSPDYTGCPGLMSVLGDQRMAKSSFANMSAYSDLRAKFPIPNECEVFGCLK